MSSSTNLNGGTPGEYSLCWASGVRLPPAYLVEAGRWVIVGPVRPLASNSAEVASRHETDSYWSVKCEKKSGSWSVAPVLKLLN